MNTTDLQGLVIQIVNKMKTRIMLLILFITNSIIYCQTLETLKKTDTIYVYFNKTHKNTLKYSDANKHIEFYKNCITYEFNSNQLNTIFFISNTYKNYDNMEKGIKNDEFLAKKSFLKKHKDVILDYDFFERNGFIKTFDVLYTKVIYLIDKDEIKGRKIKVKQVDIACFTCHGE